MLNQISLYVIIALILISIALGGGWYLTRSWDAAEIDILKADKVRLTDAVDANERTIQQMVADAQVLAASNHKLTQSIMKAEIENATAWQAIDALDLESDQALADVTGLEKALNDTFQRSVDGLLTATGREGW